MKVLVVLVAACFATSQANYGGYHGPLASPVVTPQGFLADTPEVAAAKAAHFSEVAKAGSPAGYAPGPYNGAHAYSAPAAPAYHSAPAYNSAPAYSAPAAPAYPYAGNHYGGPVTPQGFLADTPEVAAAKAAHFAEKAKVNSSPNHGPEDDGSYRPEYDNPSYSAPAHGYASAPAAPAYQGYASAPAAPAHHGYASAPAYNSYAPAPAHGSHYSGPLASPVVTAQGFLAETPEVAAAKAAHFAEFSKAGSQAPAHHGRYRRSLVAVAPVAHVAPLAYSYPYAAPYTYPYSYLNSPSGYSYSVRTW